MSILRIVASGYLGLQAMAALVWWIVLFAWPDSRIYFLAEGSPDATLLAFVAADLILYVGTAAVAAVGLLAYRSWAWPVLCVHAGAAGYASLYCWGLTLLTEGDAWLGAILMSPSLVVPGALVVALRPRSEPC